jgi:hypothetical protein
VGSDVAVTPSPCFDLRLRVGEGQHELAAATRAATGTTFRLDASNCAIDVHPVTGQWSNVSSGFASLAKYDEAFEVQYGSVDGASAQLRLDIFVFPGDIGRHYATGPAGKCTQGNVWDLESLPAHELGEAYASVRRHYAAILHHKAGASPAEQSPLDWENAVHISMGRAPRTFHSTCSW